jgi:RP/EB family microtubule-associated protein
MGTGAVYCQVFDVVYPGSIQMSRISWAAKNEYEYVQNYKLLQSGFNKQSQKKYIDVNLKFKGRANPQ